MAGDFELRGADDFLALSKRLKAEGRTGLRRELNNGLRRAARPLVVKAKEAAATELPQAGGLAALVARRGARVKISTNAARPGVSIVYKKTDPRIDQGRLYHPVFGRRPGVVQNVAPGFFSETMREHAPEAMPALQDAMETVVRRAAG